METTPLPGSNPNTQNNPTQPYYPYGPTAYPQAGGDGGDIYGQEYYQEPLAKPHGCLLFFLIVFVGLGSIASLAMSLIETGTGQTYAWFDMVYAVVRFAVAVSAIVAFYRHNGAAVYLAAIYIGSNFFYIVMILALSPSSAIDAHTAAQLAGSLIGCGIWMLYIFISPQVGRVIPPENRCFSPLAVGMLALVLSAMTINFVGVVWLKDKAKTEQAAYAADNERARTLQAQLPEGIYTDGRIIFAVPEGATCTSEINEDNLKIFTLNSDGRFCQIFSTPENCTNSNFEEAWRALTGSMPGFEFSNIMTSQHVDGYNPPEGVRVFLRKAMMTDGSSGATVKGTVCVFGYSNGPVVAVVEGCEPSVESRLATVMNSVEFLNR